MELEAKKEKELEQKYLPVVAEAQIIIVTDSESLNTANQILKNIKALRKEVEATFKPIKQAIDALKATTLEQERKHDSPLAAAQRYISSQMVTYQTREQEKIEAAERERLEKQRKKEKEEQELRDILAELDPGMSAVEVIEITAPSAPPPPVLPSLPKLAGTAFRTNWKFRIVNESLIPSEYWIVDETKIGSVVRAMKEKSNIPGIEVYSEKIAVGTRY